MGVKLHRGFESRPLRSLEYTQAVRVARRCATCPLSAPLFDELLGRLVQADVRFVVIGGLALGSWGVVRGTKDCDVVPDPAPENLDMLAHVAAELGGHVQLGESLLGSERSIAVLLRSGERALIATRLGDLDVVQGLEGEIRRSSSLWSVLAGSRISGPFSQSRLGGKPRKFRGLREAPSR